MNGGYLRSGCDRPSIWRPSSYELGDEINYWSLVTERCFRHQRHSPTESSFIGTDSQAVSYLKAHIAGFCRKGYLLVKVTLCVDDC